MRTWWRRPRPSRRGRLGRAKVFAQAGRGSLRLWRWRAEPDPHAEVARDVGRDARPDSRGVGLGWARAGGRGVRGLRLPACAGRPVQPAPGHRRETRCGAGDDCSWAMTCRGNPVWLPILRAGTLARPYGFVNVFG